MEDDEKVVLEGTISKNSSFLLTEQENQVTRSEAGRLATERCLADFDSDGSPIVFGNTKFTAKKKKVEKIYECPFGPVRVSRFVYQSSSGGSTFVRRGDTQRSRKGA